MILDVVGWIDLLVTLTIQISCGSKKRTAFVFYFEHVSTTAAGSKKHRSLTFVLFSYLVEIL